MNKLIKVDKITPQSPYLDVPKNIKELKIVGTHIFPRFGLFNDDNNFIKEIYYSDTPGYITIDNDKWDFLSLKDYERVIWC